MNERMIAVLVLAIGLGCLGGGCDGGSGGGAFKTCARVSACMTDEPTSFGQLCDTVFSINEDGGRDKSTDIKLVDAVIGCVERAKDCDAIEACVKAEPDEAAQCEDGLLSDEVCVGDVMVECTGDPDEVPDAFDCASAGLVCGERDGDAECGEALCDPDTDGQRCDGARFEECDDSGVWRAQDCRYSISYSCSGGGGGFTCQVEAGGTCGTGADGDLACVGDGPACDDETFTTRCDGQVLVSCRDGKEARLDCRDLAGWLTCGTDAQIDSLSCVPAANECLPDFDESCSAGVITFCSRGKIEQLDCTKMGLSGCASSSEGNQTVAWCTD